MFYYREAYGKKTFIFLRVDVNIQKILALSFFHVEFEGIVWQEIEIFAFRMTMHDHLMAHTFLR